MKNQAYNEIIRKLENELSCLKTQTQCFIELTEKAIGLCNKAIIEFRQMVIQDGFKDNDEEIYFFKNIKPKVNSKFFFYTEVFNLESHRPKSEKKEQIRYLKDVMQKSCRYLNDNKEFYQYYKRNKTFSDHLYFLSGNADYRIHVDSITNHIDPEFSTGYDQTFAKIIAYDQLKKYVCNEIKKLKTNPIKVFKDSRINNFNTDLDWTGPHIAVVELIYALHSAKVINYGNIEIIKLAKLFEKIFNIKLDDFYRTYKDIQGRKTIKTRFLDAMKQALLKRLEDLDK